MREINRLLKGLAKDRQPPSPLPADQLVPVPALAGSPPNVGPNGATNQLIPTILNVEEREQPEDEQQEDDRLPQLPEDVMEEISAMDLDELREYEALHATSRRLPAYLKAEVDEIYYKLKRQLHIIAIRHQLHAKLLYTHIGQTNQMRGAKKYNNFCRFDPEAREIFSASMLFFLLSCYSNAQPSKTNSTLCRGPGVETTMQGSRKGVECYGP
jgi:hypothetical protein